MSYQLSTGVILYASFLGGQQKNYTPCVLLMGVGYVLKKSCYLPACCINNVCCIHQACQVKIQSKFINLPHPPPHSSSLDSHLVKKTQFYCKIFEILMKMMTVGIACYQYVNNNKSEGTVPGF